MHCEQGVVDERYETVDIGSQRVATSLLQNSRVTTHHYRQKARNKTSVWISTSCWTINMGIGTWASGVSADTLD